VDGAVGYDEVVGSGKGGKDAKIRLIPGWKEQHCRLRKKGGERDFQCDMLRKVAGDEARCAGSESRRGCCIRRGALQTRIAGKAQVVVGAEGDEPSAFDVDADSGSAREGMASAETAAGTKSLDIGGNLLGK
jgi:hypothetical protein